MNIEKLETLKEVISDLQENLFDMSTFGEKQECGTIACMLGHAALSDKFPDLKSIFSEEDNSVEIYHEPSNTYFLNAAQAEFEITSNQASFLFMLAAYGNGWTISKKRALDQIDALIRSLKEDE